MDKQIAGRVKAEKDVRAAEMRKNVVIFALLGLLHIVHEANRAERVSKGFEDVARHVKHHSDFQELLVDDQRSRSLSGEENFFLSKMERDYILGIERTPPPEGKVQDDHTKVVNGEPCVYFVHMIT